MKRDPFYQDIIRGLNGMLDPDLFERCAAALLRTSYPGLVPVCGGCDAGMDGAIGDAEGNAYPLVATTEPDVIGNLTKSLKSYLQDGGTRRKVLLATSQSLTPKRRRNLEIRARNLGFTLIQTYTQEALADLLYRDPKWCIELLGLAGQPPALSSFPISSRPTINGQLIGREDDLDWLKNTSGDLLLEGQPGSGKTFLLNIFIQESEGLFLVNDIPTHVAQCLRAMNPKIIVVDDAHIDTDRLSRLNLLRNQTGSQFRIIATCWPGYTDIVSKSMQIPSSSIRQLEPLTRDQIAELIKSTGIAGPTELIWELVEQAEGRPGLAATLCYLCKKGDVRQVMLGESLADEIHSVFEPQLGTETTGIIAAFSLGGNAGFPMDTVAKFFGIPLLTVRNIVTELAFGGVLTAVGQTQLSVRPPSLRYALIRDVFYKGATSIDCKSLIDQTPNLAETVLAIIGARVRGAIIADNFLIELVARANNDQVWEHFSYLGPKECEWVLDNRPEKLPVVSEAALLLAPQKVIPMLLDSARTDSRQLHSNPDHPLRRIADWINSAEPGKSQVIARRKSLLDSTLSWHRKSSNSDLSLKALTLALSPTFSDCKANPGSGMKITIRNGFVTKGEMTKIRQFWPTVKEFLRKIVIVDWKPIIDLLSEWLYPNRLAEDVSEEIKTFMKDFACEIAEDVNSMLRNHPGIVTRISVIFSQCGIQLNMKVNPEFRILFPEKDSYRNWKRISSQQQAKAEKLAQKWSMMDPSYVARILSEYVNEARLADISFPRWDTFVAQTIASKVQNPSLWAESLISVGADSILVEPFLRAVASEPQQAIESLMKTCLHTPILQFAAISVGLTAKIIPEVLIKDVVSALDDRFSNWIEVACMRAEIPLDRIELLLSHENRSIAAGAAIGVWEASPRGVIPSSLMDSWQAAITKCLGNQFEGEEIFRKNPSLAFEWLAACIIDKRRINLMDSKPGKTALQVINLEQRKLLLREIRKDSWDYDIVRGIVDDILEVYNVLLSDSALKRYHLAPLAGKPDGVWIDKALMARNAGYSAKDIAVAAHGNSWFWSGNESEYWQEWIKHFEVILDHENPQVCEIGRSGKDYAKQMRAIALKREQDESVYGK